MSGPPGGGGPGRAVRGAPSLEWVRKAPWGRKGWAGPEGGPGALLAPGLASHRPLAGAGLLRGPAGRASPVDRALTSDLQGDLGAVSVAPGASQARCVASWGWAALRPLRSLRAPSSQLALRSQLQPPHSPGSQVQVTACCGAGGWGGEGGGDRCAGGGLSSVTQPPSPIPSKGGAHTPSRLASGCGRLPPPHHPLEVFWPDSPSRPPTGSQRPDSPAPNPQPSEARAAEEPALGP